MVGPLETTGGGALAERRERIRAAMTEPEPEINPTIDFSAPEQKPKGEKSVSGFGKNLLGDAWDTVKGLYDFATWIPKRIWEIAKDPSQYEKDAALLFDMDRAGNIGDAGKQLWEAVKEPYKDGIPEALYNRPFTVLLDAATLASLGGGSITKLGKLGKIPRLISLGEGLQRLPGRLAGGLVRLPLKAVPKGMLDALGVGELTRPYLRMLAHEKAQASIEKARALQDLLLRDLSPGDAKLLHRAIRVGAPEDIARLTPAARQRYDVVLRLVGEQESMLITRRLLTEPRALAANVKAAALELFGSGYTREHRKLVLGMIQEGKIKPLFASLFTVPSRELDLFSSLTRDLRLMGKVGRLEKRIARGVFETDPRVYLARQTELFSHLKAKLRWLDRVMQDLKSRGLMRAVRAGGEPPEGYAFLKDAIYKKYYEDQARAGSAVVAELMRGSTTDEAVKAAYSKLLSDPEMTRAVTRAEHMAVPRHVAALVAREFAIPGPVGRVYDRGLGYWKALATVFSPRYWLSVPIGNAFLGVLAGVGPDDLARIRPLKGLLPPEIRSRAQTEIMRTDINRFERVAGRLGEYTSAMDNTLRQGAFGAETERIRRRLALAGSDFFAFSDNAEEFLRKTALAPEEVAGIVSKIQLLEESIAARVPEISGINRQLLKLDAEIKRLEPHLARLISSSGPPAQREAALTARLKALEEARAKLTTARVEARAGAEAGVKEVAALIRGGPSKAEKALVRMLAEEEAVAGQFEREILREIRSRGGIRVAGGLLEEYREHVPRGLRLRERRGPGVPADELADELFNRGIIGGDKQDDLFAWLDRAVAAARAPRTPISELRTRARQMLETQNRAQLGQLVKNVRERTRTKYEILRVRQLSREGEAKLGAFQKERAEQLAKLQSAYDGAGAKIAELEGRRASMSADVLSKMKETGELQRRLPELQKYAAVADEAVTMGNRFAGSYLDLHPIERVWFRRAVPFYAFTKAMTLLAFRLPFMFPKRTFAWNRLSEMAMDLTEDEELPAWMSDYLPVAALADGGTLMVRVGGWNPFTGAARTGEVGEMPVPAILDMTRQNPLVKVGLDLIGGTPSWSKKPISPGEHATRLDNGTVYRYEGGKLRRVIPQTSFWRGVWYLFPQSQIAEELLVPYTMTDRGWLGFPEPIRSPDGQIMYPREFWQGISGMFARTTKVNLAEEKERERRRVVGVVRSFAKDIRRMPIDEREDALRVLRDFSEGRIKRLER